MAMASRHRVFLDEGGGEQNRISEPETETETVRRWVRCSICRQEIATDEAVILRRAVICPTCWSR